MARIMRGKARFKIQRRLGIELPGLGKPGAVERRPYPPGQHGSKRKKLSEYTVRLMEKQKLVYHYGVREGQLRNYVKKSKKIKTRAWVENLVIMLERRLDNAIFRLNMAPSILAARQMVSHGHVQVNGKKIGVPRYLIKEGDKISLSDKGYKSENYRRAMEAPMFSTIPACYEYESEDNTKKCARIITLPMPEDIPFEFNSQFVTEFYWRIK